MKIKFLNKFAEILRAGGHFIFADEATFKVDPAKRKSWTKRKIAQKRNYQMIYDDTYNDDIMNIK